MTHHRQFMSTKQMRDVVSLGKDYARAACPNPTREGCPNSSTLRAMAKRDPKLTLGDLPISHVVSCSPCFEEYTRLRRRFSFIHGIELAGASLVVLFILFTAARSVWRSAHGHGETSISHVQQPKKLPSLSTDKPLPTAPLAMTVDLASFSPTRGDEAKTAPKQIHFPPSLLRVTFLLPLGMEPGQYALRLQDDGGTVLNEMNVVGRLNGGVTSITADLDLRAHSRGSFTLMLQPSGLSWRTFPVLVEGNK